MEKQGHMRSSSSSSSSSFDSCSDLLGSLELPEKNPADYVTLSEVQQSEIVSCSKENSGAKDSCSDVLCHQVLQELEDERLLTGQVLDLCEQSMEGSKEEVPQVKDDHVTMEAPTLKDHVYGLSSSITFSKVRSLAENTVEKISQLHSSFRLPTGYLFPSKSVESVDNKPCASEVDSKMSVPTEPSHSYEEHSIEGTKFSQDFSGSKPDNRRPGWGDIKPLQPKELVNMEYMPCGGLCEKSACVKALHNVHMQGSSSVERIGLKTEQMSKMEDTTNPCLENVCGVDFKLATDTNDVTRNDALGSDSMLQVSINENKGGRPADLGKEASSDIDLKGLGFQKLQNSQQLMPFWQTSQHSDFTTMVEEVQDGIGLDCSFQDHACIPKSGLQVSVALEAGHDLQQLEESIKVFDLHKKNSVPPPPLQTLSSGSGRPDLEEVDDDQFSLISSLPGGAIQKNRMLANRPLSGKEPYFATTALGLESQARIDQQGYMLKGNESPSSICGQRVQVVGSPLLNCVDEGRDILRNDRLIVTEALETLDLQCRQQRLLEEESYGERSNQEGWKGLCIRLKSQKPFNWEEEEEENLGPDELFRYVENLDLNETYVDTVLDMEDVLLDCDESGSRGRFFLAANNSVIGTPCSSRDGSLSSSTSGLQLFISNTTGSGECTPFTVDWVEVVGAKQRKGGSSFGERIVGVKDHTVYCIKVSSGSQEWEVLRRYRDFVELYHQLRRKFNARTERPLPSPWKEVESESRKVFGSTTPNVIEVRSGRMEKCLQSLLQAGPPFSISPPLHWFLRLQGTTGGLSGFEDHQSIASLVSHKGSDVQLGALNSPHLQSPRSEIGSSKGELDHDKSPFSLGKTIKLVLEIHPNKNLKQLLSAQHHSCAGCYKHLDVEKGLVQGFVQTLGWGKPRLCEYSGQLFCVSCHLNETAVLPAQVLRHWDFTPRRVSQLAKAYLDSIYDQPMLCVSAVNPYLYSRVPILSHVKETRRKLSKMLSCMHCPWHARIQQTMVSRRYLLENNDFFALRDLEDLSKGAFAVLPGLLTAVLESLRVHITKQCSVCQDTGEWCGAGILCDDPFSPIFPFQEENITSCKLCHAPFHETCFSKCSSCPSCPKDWSKKPVLAAGCSHFKMEELGDDHTDVLPFPNGQVGDKAVDCSASSSSSGPELQGPTEEKQSQNQRNWPSFYNLLPKRRLW